MSLSFSNGSPAPLGISEKWEGLNFAIFSKSGPLALCLFSFDSKEKKSYPIGEFFLDPQKNRTGDIWHILVHQLPKDVLYAYKMGQIFLLDPYAKAVMTGNDWGQEQSAFPLPGHPYFPLGTFVKEDFPWENDVPPHIPWKDLIIYEMHVRGFTKDSSSQVKHPGTFLGVIEKIPHLLELGINAVELLPIHEWNELEYARCNPFTHKVMCNYWGYSPINFFAPMNRFSTLANPQACVREFKEMVKELHRHGIEVLLDVVFNHTAEGDKEGPTYSFRGLADKSYYMVDYKGNYLDYTGCGHSFNCNNPICQDLIVDCLRHWVSEMHVDGFRFDLASTLVRDCKGHPLKKPPLIERITCDPILSGVKLIAEPWDIGLYQVGSFPDNQKRWLEWNGKYRDCVRRFIRGGPWAKGEFATRLSGSQDLYGNCSSGSRSVNFITAHDGFTLADLVSYNQKHNESNGENNRDGMNENESWNCGIEGPTQKKEVLALRERQMRNLHLALMISQGVPMIVMGDEYAHTKLGNNNTWCQDNQLNWFLWEKLQNEKEFFRFYSLAIHFRKKHRLILCRTKFLKNIDVSWHGIEPNLPLWDKDNHFLALTLKDHEKHNHLFIAFNASMNDQEILLPKPPSQKSWHRIVDTKYSSPQDFLEEEATIPYTQAKYSMKDHSAILLKAK